MIIHIVPKEKEESGVSLLPSCSRQSAVLDVYAIFDKLIMFER